MRRAFRTVVLVGLSHVAFSGQQALAEPEARLRKAAVDPIFQRFTNRTPGCAVGVSRRGATEFLGGYGLADLERGVPIQPETVFESGSVAKQFTAAALVLMEQQGRLSLRDPLGRHLPELMPPVASIEWHQVLSHTSGLREWRPLAMLDGRPEGTYVFENRDLLQMAARQRSLNFEPGSQYSYSNTGYNLATILLERAAGDGRSFAQITHDLLFRPLAMKNTRWRSDFREVVPGRALAYTETANGWRLATPIENIIGAGGLLTTVGDLLRWNENLTEPRVGGLQMVAALERPARLQDGREIPYGAGLAVNQVDGLVEMAHSGATGGYRSWLGRYPEKGVSVAVLCNAAQADAVQLGRATARIWTQAAAPPPAVWATATQAEPLLGLYRSLRDHSVQAVEVRGDSVWFGAARLSRLEGGRFGVGAGSTLERVEGSRLRQRTPFGEVIWERVEPWTPTLPEAAAYPGVYISPETLQPVRVALSSSGTLSFQIGDRPAQRLTPLYRGAFRLEGGMVIAFEHPRNGAVTSLTVNDPRAWGLRFTRQPE